MNEFNSEKYVYQKNDAMNNSFKIPVVVILCFFSILFFTSCKKKSTPPVVTTANVSGITQISAVSGGNVTSDGGASVTARGICWGTTQNPTTAANKTNDGKGIGSFTSNLTGLTANTTYYLRAYATNSAGTGYGSQVTFNTSPIILASLTTTAVTSVTITTAVSGGNITSDGGASITARGICYGTSQNPTISGSKTSDGAGTGTFTSNLAGLTANTLYYVRAYATNNAGTVYGNQVSFTTNQIGLATLTTSSVSSITTSSAISGGNITSDGGGAISARGVCWSTTSGPTISNNKTDDGNGIGSFVSHLAGLQPASQYYVRAYATNIAGTAYGNEISFNTPASIPVLTTTVISDITTTSAYSGGNISSDGGSAVTARGVCWSTGTIPTILDSHTNDGNGTGSFISFISGLNPNTAYNVRAYATNGIGTAYGNTLSLTTLQIKTATDIDGNVYHLVTIGTQIWMLENLRTSKYRNGDPIPTGLTNAEWSTTTSGAYAIYNNDDANNTTYGKLYNWYAVADSRQLCPTGWHVPSDAEWKTLETYLTNNGFGYEGSGNDFAKSMAATSGWGVSNLPGTVGNDQPSNNSSGFTALPGGYRHYEGNYDLVGHYGIWWSSTELESNLYYARSRYLHNTLAGMQNPGWDKRKGLSVRCLKD